MDSPVHVAHLAQGSVGNIQPPRALTKDDSEEEDSQNRRFKSRSWFFTLNNPEEGDLAQLTQWFDTFTEKYVFQLEVGEKCGTPHFQGVLYFKHAIHDSILKQVAPRAFWKRTISWLGAVKYCSKQPTVIEGPWSKGITFREPIRILTTLRPWQAAEEKRLLIPCTDDRKVRWYYDATGQFGKTQFIKYMAVKHKGMMIIEGEANNVKYMVKNFLEKEDIKAAFMYFCKDTPGKIPYSTLESIKDGLLCSGKFESGVCIFNSPHVVVIANFYPDTTKLSADRWDIITVKDDDPEKVCTVD